VSIWPARLSVKVVSNTANFSDEIHTKILQSFKWQIVGRTKTPPPWRFGSKPNREQKPGRRRLFKTEDFSQVLVTQIMSNS